MFLYNEKREDGGPRDGNISHPEADSHDFTGQLQRRKLTLTFIRHFNYQTNKHARISIGVWQENNNHLSLLYLLVTGNVRHISSSYDSLADHNSGAVLPGPDSDDKLALTQA